MGGSTEEDREVFVIGKPPPGKYAIVGNNISPLGPPITLMKFCLMSRLGGGEEGNARGSACAKTTRAG